MSGVRSTHRWQLLRRVMIPAASLWALCGRPLIHDAPPRSKWTPTLDHIVPLSRGGDPYDTANLRVVHYGCNASRGNGTRRVTSRDWFAPTPTRADPHSWLGEPGRINREIDIDHRETD